MNYLGYSLITFATAASVGCEQPSTTARSTTSQPEKADRLIWTLYRNSITDPTMRIHIATFDSADDKGTVSENGLTYNGANCDIARSLFQEQEGVKVKFWCEQGRAK